MSDLQKNIIYFLPAIKNLFGGAKNMYQQTILMLLPPSAKWK
jgi:hypothetical protein